MKAFKNAIVYLENKGLQRTNILFDERIISIGGDLSNAQIIPLPEDAIVLPGFIDQHVHGAGGCDTMDKSLSALQSMSTTLAKEGTTGFLATTMTQSKENIINALSSVKKCCDLPIKNGAKLLGAHLEGPFISDECVGAQPKEHVAKPDISLFNEFYKASGENIKMVTLAPEVDGAFELVSHLKSLGVVASIGHTKARSLDIALAMEKGANCITHTYNAQSPLHHREIGTVGSALLYDELFSELICDTIHVSIPAMQLLVKNKPKDKLCLITDAIRAKGLSDGVSELGGQTVFVKNGEARLGDGTLAGSVLQMNKAIKNMVEKVNIPLLQAVDYATINPAKLLNLDKEKGSIALNKYADFAVINRDFDVIYTICEGEIIYKP